MQCNRYGVDLLVSESTKMMMQLSDYVFKSLGEIDLRGKSERMALYALEAR
jgi:hypothetical protein